jgi:hypothetical protein
MPLLEVHWYYLPTPIAERPKQLFGKPVIVLILAYPLFQFPYDFWIRTVNIDPSLRDVYVLAA